MRGRAVIAAAMTLAALASACSTHATHLVPVPEPSSGTVAGFAELCSGLPPTMLRPSPPPMTVYAQQHGRTIASQGLPGAGGRYHLSLAPGRYVISAPKSEDPPRTITLHSGETFTVDFPNHCM